MSAELSTLPSARPDLVIRPLGENGIYVVKEPRSGSYYHLGEEEHFLLMQLRGDRAFEAVAAAFADRFGQPLKADDFDDFLTQARAQGLLVPKGGSIDSPANERLAAARAPSPHNLLYCRVRLVDPDRLFTRLAPLLWFFWTPGFLAVSSLSIAAAAGLLWLNRQEIASDLIGVLNWQTAFLLWLTCILVVSAHECAHGLTCKHYGGEVHEIGFLLLLFMPCLYCNVTDAWLFRRKSQRLWVTFAGGYFELFIWSLAIFAWRLTAPATLINTIALLIAASCGLRTLFNFNPLIKLDGYYLLSDWARIPNLQQRSAQHLMAHVRWLLWGADRPEAEPRGGFLLSYGVASLAFSLFLMTLMLFGLVQLSGTGWGWVYAFVMVLLMAWGVKGLFRGVSAGEVSKMMQFRRKRAVLGALLVALAIAGLFGIEIEDREGGTFALRAAARVDLRAPVASFLRELTLEEGESVNEGATVARLEIPDLASRTTQKAAEIQEARARLHLLLAGTRPEQIHEQEQRVQRALTWLDLARADLEETKKALRADLVRLNKQIDQYIAELEFAEMMLVMDRKLEQTRAAASLEVLSMERQRRVARSQVEQARAQKQSRETLGVRESEAELARRQKELADAQATLTLMKVSPRREEVDAEKARVGRLDEEMRYLMGLRGQLLVVSPIPGVIATPHLKDKCGQYVREGDLICQIEDASEIEAEIALPEEKVARVRPGQAVVLKVRSLPFETYSALVSRVAPTVRADPNRPSGATEVQGVLSVYCQLTNEAAELRPGMNGYARIVIGRRSVGTYLLDRLWRLLRTEFW
jgi:multidrug efflux pump subunit AcrA (membrane-fusion protein)